MEIKTNGKKSGGGIVGGIILAIIGIGVLWWNEGRTVKNEGAISEFEGSYIEVDSNNINSENDGKPIYTNGNLVYEGTGSTDSEFGVNVDSAVLKRSVEMYQWKEDCSDDSDGNETCNYTQTWSSDLIDSSTFENNNYTNPSSIPYGSSTDGITKMYSSYIKVNSFDIDYFKDYLSTDVVYNNLSEEVASNHNMVIKDNCYTNVNVEKGAQVGDVKVCFFYNNAEYLSLIGMQHDDTIVEYTASNGYKVKALSESNVPAVTLIQNLRDQNNLIKWLCRLGGTLLVIFGLIALISPIQKLASYVPVLGNIFNATTSLIMGTVGLCISLLVIAIAWFRYRPLLSIFLIVIGIGAVVLARILKTKKNDKVTNPVETQE